MEIRANIAKAVKKTMQDREKSLSALAEELDIPLSSMKKYASGQSNPRADTIELLAEKFGMTPAEMVSNLPREWEKAETVLRAAQEFGGLTPEQKEKGVQLFLDLVDLFTKGK